MKPENIILLRHGESEANIDKGLYETNPDHLMQLTQKGENQCIRCGQFLKTFLDGKKITVWNSPYTRTRQTSETVLSQIENAHIKIKEDPRLREQEWGNFYTLDQAVKENEERKRHSYFFYRIKDGESGADVYDRISTFLETLFRDFANDKWTQTVLISTHGITSLIFLMRFFHWKYEEYEAADRFSNCDFVVLSLDSKTNRYSISHDARSSTKS
jgi:broad specificity phosphatase PhoE